MEEVKGENEGPYHGWLKAKKKTKGRTVDCRSQRRKRRAVPRMAEVKEENEGSYHGWLKAKKKTKGRATDGRSQR